MSVHPTTLWYGAALDSSNLSNGTSFLNSLSDNHFFKHVGYFGKKTLPGKKKV